MGNRKDRSFAKVFRTTIRLTPLDWLILVLALAFTAWISMFTWTLSARKPQLRVEAGGETWVYPLDQARDLHFQGPLGETEIHVEDGKAWFVDSPCKDKLCVASGRLGSTGSWSACLPNQVIATVESSTDGDDPDAPDGMSW